MSKVLVTGASGFLALHIIGELLNKGYKVIGTVRSQTKADKLSKDFNEKFDGRLAISDLEFVIVSDISAEDAFNSIFQDTHKDIKYILHTASPFSFGVQGELEKAFRDPAVNGTVNVLKAVKQYAPQVEKIVITSSMAAIENPGEMNSDPNFIHDESVWNPIEWKDVTNENQAYVASKKLAEKSAWDFIKQIESNDITFKLNTINPPFIFGPQYFDNEHYVSLNSLNTSSSVIGKLLQSDPSNNQLFDGLALCSVDVRDVAKFHIMALDKNINNERLFPVASRFSEQGILDIINANYPQLKGKIARGYPEGELGIATPAFNNDKTKKLVGGFEFLSLKRQVVDTVDQILEHNSCFK